LTLAPVAEDNVYVRATNSTVSMTEFANAESAQVGQGFFVKTLEIEAPANQFGNLNFNNSMRVSENSQFFRLNSSYVAESSASLFRLELTSATGSKSEAVVGFYEYASDGLDIMDSQAFGSPIYTLYQGNRFSLQGRALPWQENTVIQLGYNAEVSGNFMIDIIERKGLFENVQSVILFDTQLQMYHNLSLSSYVFETESGTNDSRFEILFFNILSTETIENQETAIIVFEKDHLLHIQAKGDNLIANITIVDLNGRIIYKRNGLQTNSYIMHNFTKTAGVLLLHTTTAAGKKQIDKLIY
jgi:hypothetical protein